MYAVFLLVETMGDAKIADLTLTFIAVWLLLGFCFACFFVFCFLSHCILPHLSGVIILHHPVLHDKNSSVLLNLTKTEVCYLI